MLRKRSQIENIWGYAEIRAQKTVFELIVCLERQIYAPENAEKLEHNYTHVKRHQCQVDHLDERPELKGANWVCTKLNFYY